MGYKLSFALNAFTWLYQHNLIEYLNIHPFGIRYALGGKEKVGNLRLCSNIAQLGAKRKRS